MAGGGGGAAAAAAAAVVPAPGTNYSLTVSPTSEAADCTDYLLTVKTPPFNPATETLDVYSIDHSGSMAAEAVVGSAGAREATGKTILDLVISSVRASIMTKGPNHFVAIIGWSDASRVLLVPTRMDAAGKNTALYALSLLHPGGSTHLWAGLEAALRVVESAREEGKAYVRVASVNLLTDGLPNVDPPNLAGFPASLRDYRAAHGFCPNTNVIGFGNNIQQDVLADLAQEGGGHFVYIPSADMMATNFVCLGAAISTACCSTPSLKVKQRGSTWVPVPNVTLGLMPFNTTMSFIIPKTNDLDFSTMVLSVGDIAGTRIVANMTPFKRENAPIISCASWRSKMVTTLRTARSQALIHNNDDALKLIRTTSSAIRADPMFADATASPYLQGLLNDLEKEVAMAVRLPNLGWGNSYILSLARAHELMICANFKDPGLQSYATPEFKDNQTTSAAVFRAALASEAEDAMRLAAEREAAARARNDAAALQRAQQNTRQQEQRTRAAASLLDQNGGCVHGAGKVKLANGTTCRLDALRAGAKVRLACPTDQTNPFGTVTVTLKTKLISTTDMVELNGGLIATAWHPVKVGDEWQFPMDVSTQNVRSKGPASNYPEVVYVYSIGVTGGYGIIVDDIPVITLGHGILEHKVLAHKYYGTDLVLKEVEMVKAWCADNGKNWDEFAIGEGDWRWSTNTWTGEVRLVKC